MLEIRKNENKALQIAERKKEDYEFQVDYFEKRMRFLKESYENAKIMYEINLKFLNEIIEKEGHYEYEKDIKNDN